MSHVPAGWYDDGTGQQRYWDGQQWLDHVQADVAPAHVEVAPASAPLQAHAGIY